MIQQNTLAELGRFSMMVAHEFKNPLSIIKGSLNNLKKEHAGILADNVMVRYMEEEIHRLNRLIEDFLVFSKPLNPVFRQTDLNEMLSMCMRRFSVHAEALLIGIDADVPDEPCMANVDRDLLIRVVDNLIKNALESSEPETRVRVSAMIGEGTWELCIADQGIGIPEENMTRIFEPFFTTRSKGSGLGLAFVGQVVKAHNGTIQARNLPGNGACFTLQLPVSEALLETSRGEERQALE
jgi:signal transduction histidine kinase